MSRVDWTGARAAAELSLSLDEPVRVAVGLHLGLHLTDLTLSGVPMKAYLHYRIASLVLVICLSSTIVVFGTSSSSSSSNTITPTMTATTAPPTKETETAAAPSDDNMPISLCFSDVDGTLVHYPAESSHRSEGGGGSGGDDGSNSLIFLPPSSTGMRGIISSRTLRLAQRLRSEGRVRLVLVSGMRGTTLLKRLPYLPRADAYACDAGGRIYYPVDCSSDDSAYDGPIIRPVKFDGATSKDLEPFGIVEDEEWKRRMQSLDAAGEDGYDNDIPIKDRGGLLWDYARTLQSQGFVLDFKGYSTCFRVNRKQQRDDAVDDAKFASLMKRAPPPGLARSVNLGCVDFYPTQSGKRNACHYLATKFTANGGDDLLSKAAVCICDDDNDTEMALACRHAFIPGITSESMQQTIDDNPGKFTVTEDATRNIVETTATEEALTKVLAMISSTAAL